MLLIDLVEYELEPILSWPTQILFILLVDVPNPRGVEELSAFFFGNGLPYGLAWRLYKACNPTVTRATLEVMYDFYSIWKKSHPTPGGEYYDMRIRKFLFINRPLSNQLQRDKPEVIGMDFGNENTGCQMTLRFILEEVRKIEV
jgi:hypothetical protein